MKFQIRPILIQQTQRRPGRGPAAVIPPLRHGQSLPEGVTSASELPSWFGLYINLIYVLINQIKWVGLSTNHLAKKGREIGLLF